MIFLVRMPLTILWAVWGQQLRVVFLSCICIRSARDSADSASQLTGLEGCYVITLAV